MIVRGSLERLVPVLMTALVTAFALAPLLFEAERPGTENPALPGGGHLLGLISSTLLDTFPDAGDVLVVRSQGRRASGG